MERQNSIIKKITNIFTLILRLFCRKKDKKKENVNESNKL